MINWIKNKLNKPQDVEATPEQIQDLKEYIRQHRTELVLGMTRQLQGYTGEPAMVFSIESVENGKYRFAYAGLTPEEIAVILMMSLVKVAQEANLQGVESAFSSLMKEEGPSTNTIN